MKSLFSVLASIAILFSMPALASSIVDESASSEAWEDSEEKEADSIEIDDERPGIDGAAPICRGSG